MEITTRFKVGDKVLYLNGTKLIENIIHSIKVDVGEKNTNISYFFRIGKGDDVNFDMAYEPMVFASKTEFINQLDK